MKKHPVQSWPAFEGQSDTDPADRLAEGKLALNMNAICTPTGQITDYGGTYPVTMADALGVTTGGSRTKIHSAARFRGKNSIARAVAIVGSNMMRSGPNNIYDPWLPVTFLPDYEQPLLDRPAAFVFRNRYCYHQNGVDLPFRVKMEEDDETTASTDAEVLGILPPLHGPKAGSLTSGTLFPDGSITDYAVTFVYGNRGESGPSPRMSFTLFAGTGSKATCPLTYIPLGPTGVTARRIYRTQIGRGEWRGYGAELQRERAYKAPPIELFFLAEIPDNTTTTYTDGDSVSTGGADNSLDYSRRCPPPRPLPPISKYQIVHQDRIIWANLRDHPWVFGVVGDPTLSGSSTYALTISNTGNGTITVVVTGGAAAGTRTVSDYKTKSLREIWQGLQDLPRYDYIGEFTQNVGAGDGTTCVIAPGVDWDRTYRFREVTSQAITGDANTFWFEAIDDTTDAVVVDGTEKFPNRVMFSNLSFPEEINPLNAVDVSRHDVYPITGLFHNDYTLGVCTENDIWLITGSFSVDPDTFEPDFSIGRSQSEHGSFCTRPDAIATTPKGFVFVAKDGLRMFQGQGSVRFGRDIKRRLMERILVEPRARDNVSLCYENGRLYIAYPGMEVA